MNKPKDTERLTAWTLAGIAIAEGVWVVPNALRHPATFAAYLGFKVGASGTALGWLLAMVVTTVYVAHSLRLPSVRANLFRLTRLKALALAVALTAGILEEVVFRKSIMDALGARGEGPLLQIASAGIVFGLAHGIWGLMGRSLSAAVNAAAATGLLGSALGVVYLASGRSLAPCVTAHFLINVLIEPGLVLAATRGEMARRD